MRDALRAVCYREIKFVPVTRCQLLQSRRIFFERVLIATLRGGVHEHHIHVMIVRHRAALDRLPRQRERALDIFPHEGELALRLERQRPSVKLIALPVLGLTRHADHIIVRFLRVLFGLLCFATQRMDTRAQRDKESGLAHALA